MYDLYDDAHVKASDGEPDYIWRIIEMFESKDRALYFTAQWYYLSTDMIIKDNYISDPKCVFFSKIHNDNPLECLAQKLNIVNWHSMWIWKIDKQGPLIVISIVTCFICFHNLPLSGYQQKTVQLDPRVQKYSVTLMLLR